MARSKMVMLLYSLVLVGTEACLAQNATLTAGSVTGLPGATVTTSILLTNDTAAEGFSLGLAHDPLVAALDSFALAAPLDSLQGGVDPAVYIPGSGIAGGFTVAVIMDLSPPFVTIPVGVGQPLVTCSYVIANNAGPQTSVLGFSNFLGTPPVETVVVTAGSVEATLTTTNGTLEVLPVPFVRGDCNDDGGINLVDVIVCLRRAVGVLALGNCDDVNDVNDDGTLNINDGIHLANYALGGAGPPPPAPFPACGVDLTNDGFACAMFTSCP